MTRREFLGLLTVAIVTKTVNGQSDKFDYEAPPVPVLTVKMIGTDAVLNWQIKESGEWQLQATKYE